MSCAVSPQEIELPLRFLHGILHQPVFYTVLSATSNLPTFHPTCEDIVYLSMTGILLQAFLKGSFISSRSPLHHTGQSRRTLPAVILDWTLLRGHWHQ